MAVSFIRMEKCESAAFPGCTGCAYRTGTGYMSRV